MRRFYAVGANWLQRGEYRSVKEVVEAYQAVTSDEICNVLKKYPLTQETTVAIGPLKKLDMADKP